MGKMILRYWLKFSLHTARGVHESSIGMKVGVGFSPVRHAALHFRFALVIILRLPLQPRDTRTRRRKYENIAGLVSEEL